MKLMKRHNNIKTTLIDDSSNLSLQTISIFIRNKNTRITRMNDTQHHKLYLNSQLTHTKCTVFDAVGKSTASINFKMLSWKAEKTRGSTNANKMRRQIVYFPIFTLLKNKNPWKFGWTEHQEVRVRTRASWKVGKRAVTPCWQ